MGVSNEVNQSGQQTVILQSTLNTVCTFLAAYFLIILYRRQFRVRAPRVGKSPWLSGLSRARADFVKNGRSLTKLGYDKYKNTLYWVQTGDMERLVLPNRYIDELRKLPDSVLDSRQAVVERNLGWYNGVDIILQSTAHVHVCRTQLVQNLASLTQGQITDLGAIINDELGTKASGGEYSYFEGWATLLSIANRTVAKALVGEQLCHSKDWLDNSLQTTVNVGMHCKSLQAYPAILRPLAHRLLKSRVTLEQNYQTAEVLLAPVISQRVAGDSNMDVLQWLIDSNKDGDSDVPFLAKQTMFVAIAAVRSTATSMVNTLLDIIEYKEYQAVLRQEISEALETCGGWSLATVQRLERLDSFIKESQRLNHQLLLSFNRKIQRTVTLSDGLTLPAGTFVCTPAYWTARDPELFSGGDIFTPWRWYELRKQAQREGRSETAYLASSTSSENLHWGYGRSACPGRFMASAVMQLIIAWIIWHYDTRFAEGQTAKAEPLFVDEKVMPDPKQKIGFRLRQHSDIAVDN